MSFTEYSQSLPIGNIDKLQLIYHRIRLAECKIMLGTGNSYLENKHLPTGFCDAYFKFLLFKLLGFTLGFLRRNSLLGSHSLIVSGIQTSPMP